MSHEDPGDSLQGFSEPPFLLDFRQGRGEEQGSGSHFLSCMDFLDSQFSGLSPLFVDLFSERR